MPWHDGSSTVRSGSELETVLMTYTDNHAGKYSVIDYGADPTGTAFSTTAFQNCAAAANGRSMFIPGGTYKLDGGVSVTSGSLNVIGEGPDIVTIKRTTADVVFNFAGSKATAINLSANAVSGAKTLTFASSGAIASINAGDYINLFSNQAYPGSFASAVRGEIVRVISKAGAVLTLQAPIIDTYNTADVGRVSLLTLLKGCSVSGLTIDQDAPSTTDVTKGYINFKYTQDCRVTDVVFRRHEQFAVQYDSSLDSSAINCTLYDATYDGGVNYFGYGILLRGAAQTCTVIGCEGRRAQVANGGGSGDGIPRWIRYIACRGSEQDKQAFSTHADCQFFSIVDCEVTTTSATAIELKGPDHLIQNCRVNNGTGIGIFLTADSATVFPQRCRIVGCHIVGIIDDTGGTGNIGSGIALQGQDHVIQDCYIQDVDGHGISINVSGAGDTCSGHTITNCLVRNGGRDSTVFSGFRIGSTITNTVFRDCTMVASASRQAFRFDGGSGTNTGCQLINPAARACGTLIGSNEEFAMGYATSVKTKAGIPADGDFPHVPADGTLAADETNNKIYVRVSGVWKGVTVA
jgi:hypothetical protein